MDGILYIRAVIISVIKRYEAAVLFILKFFLGFFVFSGINQLGFLRDELLFILEPGMGPMLLLILAFLFSILPLAASYGLMIVYITLHLSANTEIAAIVLLVSLCVLFFYIRLAPKESILILLTVIGFYFRLPYLIPLITGLYFGLTGAIPVMLGVLIWHYIPVIIELMSTTGSAGFEITELADTIPVIYQDVLTNVTGNYEWLFIAFSFTMVIITVYAISRLSIDYSAEVAVILGAIVNIISFIVAAIAVQIDVNIFGMLFATIISAAIACVIRFFDIALDYTRVERIQFSDEDNYYYVKVVPKLLSADTMKKKRKPARPERER